MTTAFETVLVLLFGICLVVVVPTVRKLCRRCHVEELSPEWLENFSVTSYHMMEHLLSDEDFNFLSRQPGFDLSLYRKLRRDRLYIFRQYLNRMISDFNRLHLAARLLAAQAPEDQSSLMAKLIWLKVRFSSSVVRAEFRYLLCHAGMRSLSVRVLILRLEELSAELATLSALQTA
ncbi:MAG: hypothetical protein JOZ62_04340 [Acidobacteriaceae bacterium]|nr:hypothetical protein [Acidobacteriaceae bacterium]